MSRVIASEQLEVCEEVGRGGFGVVYRGIVKATGQEVAIKQIDLEHELADFFEVNREIQILSECRSPQITQYLGCFVKGYKLWVIMEFVDGGSLFELLVPGPITDEKTILIIAGEILLALEYLHSLGKIHRDLKSQNILLNQNGEIKLTDFGVSTQLYSSFSRRNTTVGTPYWMAPEVIMNNTGGHSFKADIWSLGCCIFELRNGKPPLQDHYTPMQALRKISSCKNDGDFLNLIELNSQSDWSSSLTDFLAKCFSTNPRNRPTASKLLQHEFILGKRDFGPEICRRKLKKVITRKRLWDQENHVIKSQRVYAPTEIAQNQNKWRAGGSPKKGTNSIHFDFSTIKDDPPDLQNGDEKESKRIAVSPSRNDTDARSDTSKNNKAMKTDFRKVLNRAFTKLEQRNALSTENYDRIVSLNDELLELFTPIQSADPSGSQSKILVCQYLKYLLKEISKQTSGNKLQLQKAIVPSYYLQPTNPPTESVKKQNPPTSMDEIERSLLGSWLDKLEK